MPCSRFHRASSRAGLDAGCIEAGVEQSLVGRRNQQERDGNGQPKADRVDRRVEVCRLPRAEADKTADARQLPCITAARVAGRNCCTATGVPHATRADAPRRDVERGAKKTPANAAASANRTIRLRLRYFIAAGLVPGDPNDSLGSEHGEPPVWLVARRNACLASTGRTTTSASGDRRSSAMVCLPPARTAGRRRRSGPPASSSAPPVRQVQDETSRSGQVMSGVRSVPRSRMA